MTQLEERASEEFDALFRSLDEQRQQEVLQMLRRLATDEIKEPDPEEVLASV